MKLIAELLEFCNLLPWNFCLRQRTNLWQKIQLKGYLRLAIADHCASPPQIRRCTSGEPRTAALLELNRPVVQSSERPFAVCLLHFPLPPQQKTPGELLIRFLRSRRARVAGNWSSPRRVTRSARSKIDVSTSSPRRSPFAVNKSLGRLWLEPCFFLRLLELITLSSSRCCLHLSFLTPSLEVVSKIDKRLSGEAIGSFPVSVKSLNRGLAFDKRCITCVNENPHALREIERV